MSNAQSAEMVFSSNRADLGAPVTPSTLVSRSNRLDLAQPKSTQSDFEKILDRMEQLEFALAEALIRADEPVEGPETSVVLNDLSGRIDALSRSVSDLASRQRSPEAGGADLAEQLGRIADRLDAAAASRADETAMIAARLTALEAGAETRFAPIEAALQALSIQLKEETSQDGKAALSQIQAAQTQLLSRLDALPEGAKQLAAKVDALQQSADMRPEIAAMAVKLAELPTTEELAQLLSGIGRAENHLKSQTDIMADGLATVEAKLAAQIAHVAEAVDTVANRPTPAPDIAPLREMTARHMVAQKTIADRHAAQIAQLSERFAKVEDEIKALPDREAVDGIETALNGALESNKQPLVSRLDALTGMVTTLANDVKLAQDSALDLSQLAEPLLARMDRLDATAEQRQRELNRDVAEIGARPVPVTDLTPIRESLARMMVALQTMHQSREASDSDITSKISALSDGLQSLPDRIEAGADQRQRDVLREVGAIAERPIPAPDLSPVRETMSRFMVALKGLEDARANSEAELAAKFAALTDRVENMPSSATSEEIAEIRRALEPIATAAKNTDASVQALAVRPMPALDASAVRSAFSQQMVAISTWMKRQDVLQSAMSDLLETLVEQGGRKADENALPETLKTLISRGPIFGAQTDRNRGGAA